MSEPVFRLGATTVQKVFETDLNGMTFGQLMPSLDVGMLDRHPNWLPSGTTDGEGHAFMSLHAWLVRHEGQVILIDTGAGNDKSRPQQPVLDHLDNPFLDRLAALGVQPTDVDLILHTHIHSDHVGWDTRLVDGAWRASFPNAEIIVSSLEYDYGEALTAGDEDRVAALRHRAGLGEPVRIPVEGTFADSIAPLGDRVRRIVVDGTEVLPGIRFISTPGHSIDHASIALTVGDGTALFSGDVFHHPVEIYHPEVTSVFCEFPDATIRSRKHFLERAAATGALVFTSHFPCSSAGWIGQEGGGYRWHFAHSG